MSGFQKYNEDNRALRWEEDYDYYFDNASSTVDSYPSYFCAIANPSSIHRAGREAKKIVDDARKGIKELFGAEEGDVIFTSGGTMANNLVFMGLRKYFKETEKNTIITTKIEHPSVLECCKALEKDYGFNVIYLDVNEYWRINLEDLEEQLTKYKGKVGLVSVQWVNNEVGSIQKIKDIADLCEDYGVLFHTDAVQAVGHININLKNIKIDFLSMSGHKFHSMKGIGALYCRDKNLLSPILYGGGQEFGLVSGTENVEGISSMYYALRVFYSNAKIIEKNFKEQREIFVDKLMEELSDHDDIKYRFNFSEDSAPYILNITFFGIPNEALVLYLSNQNIFISAGSACHSKEISPSHVLKAVGMTDLEALSSVRISLNCYDMDETVGYVAKKIGKAVKDFYGKLFTMDKDEND